MRRYVLASHGKMAEGIKTTLEIIIGPQEDLICVNAYTDECPDPLPEFQKLIEQYPNDEIVIMTDMLGGSVNNNAVVLTKNPNVHVVTGMNLAVVISIIMSDQNSDTKEVINHAIEQAREMIIYCNDLEADEEDDDF
ncbi:PTS mannose transporter subunit IIC [Eubacterium ventriosum]|uniref:PTS sugar transporter subunit IIA domain-containing protein n=1 Tax=Eubacterium ventriosum TaxID=39496 RepID=UPI00189C77B7